MDKVRLGVDTGSKGAIAVMALDGSNRVSFCDLKDYVEAYNYLITVKKHYIIESCMVEYVHALGNVGAKSTFVFGRNFGSLCTVLDIAGIPFTFCNPKDWQKANGISLSTHIKKAYARKKRIKQLVYQQACKRYPYATKLMLGKMGGILDGRSDALLIGHYAKLLTKKERLQ